MNSSQEAGPNIHERLGAMGIDPAALLLPEQVELQQVDVEAQRQQQKIEKWQTAVESVKTDTVALRERLESRFKDDVENGRITAFEDAEKRITEIDTIVARGPERSRTYNGRHGSRYHRAQTYYVTVDEQGNIWGEFEPGRDDQTGQPVTPGMHIVHKNPTLKDQQR